MLRAKDVLWAVQTNMGSQSDIGEWTRAVERSGASLARCEIIPFSGEIPDIRHNGPVIAYGSVSFVRAALAKSGWFPCAFAGEELFCYDNWAEHYGSMLLNDPASCRKTTVAAFPALGIDPCADIFARPQHDTKSFNGAVWNAAEFSNWCKGAAGGDYENIGPDTPILIGTPYGISAEYRLFVVDGRVASSSLYRKNGRLAKEPGCPAEVSEFAAAAIRKWDPAAAYVLDIGISAGNPYIIEAQGFNSAGHYACDLDAVVSAANALALRLWQERKSQ